MINTKLIFVEGLPGVGKSITSQYIARQLEKNGFKVKVYNETDDDHPLDYSYDIEDDTECWQEHQKKYPEKWIDLSNSLINSDYVYILESCIYQKPLWPFFYDDCNRQDLKNFAHNLCSNVNNLNPVIIYFYQSDVVSLIKQNYQRRGNNWKQWFINFSKESLYCKNRNLDGEAGSIKYMSDFADLSTELFHESDFKKIGFENTEQDWDNYRKQILDLLEIPMIEEKLFDDSFLRYCGNYSGIIIHKHNNRLCMDGFWTNITLMPLKDDEFQMEGYPIVIKFITDKNDAIVSFKVIKSLTIYKEGLELFKITPLELDKNELDEFCGEFYCVSAKLTRKILLKDGILCLLRGNNSYTKLLTLSQTKLIAQGTCSLLNFEFNDISKQFIFSGYGHEDMVFVQTK